MRKRLLAATVVLCGLVLVAGAVPMLGAGTGSIAITVTAGPPSGAGACIQLSASSWDVGSVPFSTGTGLGGSGSPSIVELTTLRVINCLDPTTNANESILARGTDAQGATAHWNLDPNHLTDVLSCSGRDSYALFTHFGGANGSLKAIGKTDDVVKDASGNALVISPGSTGVAVPTGLHMPCAGSSGAGETMSLSITFTGIAA